MDVSVYGGTEHWAAKLPDVTSELSAAAKKIQTAARVIAAAEAGSRPADEYGPDYHTTFHIGPTPGPSGVMDYEVYTDHPAGAFIELGHHNYKSGRWVPGKHVMLRAIEAASTLD